MTDERYRAALIACGSLVPLGDRRKRSGVVTVDHVGKRAAAADIFYGEGVAMARAVVANRHADPDVKAILMRWIARQEAA